MKKSKYFIIFFFLPLFLLANDIQVEVIIENCKSCHGQNYQGNNYISSLKRLEKEEFISQMNNYIISNDDHVMSRISKVLNELDIKRIAERIYGKDK